MAIQDTVDLIIDEAIERAREHSDEAINKADEATQAASEIIIPLDPGNLDTATGITVTPPTQNYADIFKDCQTALKDEIIAQLNSDWNDFLDTYFPLTLSAAQVNWLEDAILNGGTGIESSVEDAIYNRGRDRVTEKSLAEIDEVTDRFARMGWSNPPGALSKQIERIRMQTMLASCEFNRDVAIEAARQEQNNVQFAVGEATKLQTAVWDAATAFVNSVVRAYDPAVRSGAGVADAAAEFYRQTLQYYRTFLFAEQFLHDHRSKEIDIDLRKDDLAREIVDNRASRMTDAALGAARTLGDMAASSLAGQNTMASLTVEELT